MGDITEWLAARGFGDYADAFVENRVDLAILPSLTAEDLKDIGVAAVGDRRRLLNEIAALTGAEAPSPAAPAAPAEGQSRQVCVLFADISGFTRLSGELGAEATHDMLNGFFAAVDEAVRAHGGSVDKHIGDAVMAVFGAPVAHTNDPERALRAALGIHEAVKTLPQPVPVHVGVATGLVVASATGSAAHSEYTVIGDSVNLAARLTDMARAGETLVSASLRRAVGDLFLGESLGDRDIDGVAEPVGVWRLGALAEAAGVRRPFVGRRAERAAFAEAVAACRQDGAGATFILRGEAGIGKTRLLEEFERAAIDAGFASHGGLVLDFGAGKGRDAIRAIVRSLVGLAPNAGKTARAEAAGRAIADGLVDEARSAFLNDLLDLDQSPALSALYEAMDNAARNQGKRDTVRDLVRNRSRAAPLLLRIEDMHWADTEVLAHAAMLADEAADSPVLLAMTTRPTNDPFDAAWREARRAPPAVMTLPPMDLSDAAVLARGFGNVPAEVLATCVERANGNPLFLEQLLLNADSLGEGELPGSVQGIVQARVDALGPDARRTLQAASVLGQRFDRETVEAVMTAGRFAPEALVAGALIRPIGDDYLFAHALIREGVYASLLGAQRRELHGRAASWFGARDAQLNAQHLDAADDPEAPAAYLAAARQQGERFRAGAALRLVERALELDSPARLRAELTCYRGEILRDLGRTAESIEAYQQAAAAAPDDECRCAAHIGLAAGMRIADRMDEAFDNLAKAEAIAAPAEMSAELAEIHYIRGNLYFPLSRIEDCLTEHEASLRHARVTGSVEAEARALGGLGDAHYLAGRMKTANDYFTRCVNLAAENGLRRIQTLNMPMQGWTECFVGRLDEAYEVSDAALRLAREIGESRPQIIAAQALGEVDAARGEWALCGQHGEAGLVQAQRIGATRFMANAYFNLARRKAYHDGDLAGAWELMLESYRSAEETGAAFQGPWVLGLATRIAPTKELRDWALAKGEEILAGGAVSHNHFLFYSEAAEACRIAGDHDRALGYVDALERFMAQEPLDLPAFYIARIRLLIQCARGAMDETTLPALRDLRDRAMSARMAPACAALDEAIAALEG